MAGGSASAHLCVIASGAGQISIAGWQGQADEASVFYRIPILRECLASFEIE
jgi:hypothetical protein